MTDYFALLGQPRKPWLDPDKLRAKYEDLTRSDHPDRRRVDSETGLAPVDFAAITEAFRVLSDPRLRLKHLLNLGGYSSSSPSAVPPDLVEFFPETAAVSQDADRLVSRLSAADNALTRSVLQAEAIPLRHRIEQLENK